MKWPDGTPKSEGNAFDIKESTISKYFYRRQKTQEEQSKSFDFTGVSNFNIHIASREESDKTNAIRNSA